MNTTYCNYKSCHNGSNLSKSSYRSGVSAVLIFGAITGFIPNVIMIAGIYTKKSLQKPTYFLIANLAICDLMLSSTTLLNVILPTIAAHISISRAGYTIICKFLAIFPGYWSYTASVQTLTIISAERYQAIFRPANKLTAKRSKVLCLFAWGLSLLISFPIIITTQSVVRNRSRYSCVEYTPYSIWITIIYMILFIFQFALPAAVMIILYSLILRHLRKRSIAGQSESNRSKILKRKSIHMVLATTVIFFIFSSPWAISLVIIAILGNNLTSILAKNSALTFVLYISRFTLPFTTIYNPIVYCIFNQQIRQLYIPCCYATTRKINAIDANTKAPIKIARNSSNIANLTSKREFLNLPKQDTLISTVG